MNALTVAGLGAFKLQSVKDFMYKNSTSPGLLQTVRSKHTVYTHIFSITFLPY